MEPYVIAKFLMGAVLMMVGMPMFLLGIDISIAVIGEQISEALIKTNILWMILAGGVILGFLVTVAEPDLHILSGQTTAVTNGIFNGDLMILLVSVGVGVLSALALFRIIKNHRLNRVMTGIYGLIFIFALFVDLDFLAIAIDAAGCTTGSISVPFLLALAAGTSAMTRTMEGEEDDSFGMLGIASTGGIIAVLFQGAFWGTGGLTGSLPPPEFGAHNVWQGVFGEIPVYAIETLIALAPILIVFLIINVLLIHNRTSELIKILVGSIYTLFGLTLFLTGVNTGFIEASRAVGYILASSNHSWVLMAIGILFGVITIPAEPSVHILTKQIENETAGSINSLVVMFTLCIGVAAAVGLSLLRILIPALQLWHIILPAMMVVIILSYVTQDIFVGIAYDSGGVAAGTMTAAFILPFAQGAAEAIETASVVSDGFGVIALVATTPLITVQVLGWLYKVNAKPRAQWVPPDQSEGE